MKSKSVFVSHSTEDAKLAEVVVELLEEGIGVPESEIFCSSVKGLDIPAGENFISYMKGQMQQPAVVILLLTPSYFASRFCLCELGAAWVKSHRIFPILVPPLSYDDVKDVLTGVQVTRINDDIKYNELRDYLTAEIECEKKSSTKWDTKRRKFLSQISVILPTIESPVPVSSEAYSSLEAKLRDSQKELDSYEQEIDKLKGYIKDLETCKDAAAVKNVRKRHRNQAVSEEFEQITGGVAALAKLMNREVFKFALCDYYGKPYEIDRLSYGEFFDDAIRRNMINIADEAQVNWNNNQMHKLENLLLKLSKLVEGKEEEEENEKYSAVFDYYEEEYTSPLEPDNQEFWEEHYWV